MRTSLLALSFVVTACSSAASLDTSSPESVEREPSPKATSALETVPCRFLVPKSAEGKDFRCADLTVPENRQKADSRTIKLHMAIVKGKAGGVPTVDLQGGPGGGSELVVGGLTAKRSGILAEYGKFLEHGDLILFDQRGTGRSIPRLSCPAGASGEPDTASCRDRFVAEGVDLAAYDTRENAEDVHDLKVALGVDKIDLHGISYGTRLELEILKRHPEDIRSAVVDGVMPPDVPVTGQFEVALDGVLTQVFTACAADAKCNATYGDLETAFTQLKAKLDGSPFKLRQGFESFDYDWYAFTQDLSQGFYGEGFGGTLPFKLRRMLGQTSEQFQADLEKADEAGEAAFEAEMALDANNPLSEELAEREAEMTDDDVEAGDVALGMYISVTCNDYTQHETIEAARKSHEAIRPELHDEESLAMEFQECKTWPTRPSDALVQMPAKFAGPVFVIGGRLDPATPFFWAERVASTLQDHRLAIVPTGGHGLTDACGAGLKGAFYADPSKALDLSCATDRAISFFYDEPRTVRLRQRLHGHPTTAASKILDRVTAAARPSAAMLMEALHRKHR